MALDPESKNLILERLSFYRELGIEPLYKRGMDRSSTPANLVEELLDLIAAEADRLGQAQEQTAGESYIATADDRVAKLTLIADDIGPNCQRCKLAKLGRKRIVFGTGDPHAELMFIGEGPGADEDEQGLPFVGRAGQLLNNMIAAMGLKREQVYIANIVKCRPPGNRTPEKDEVDACSPFLFRQLEAIQPRLICCLGAPAVRTVLGLKEGMLKVRGRF